MLDMFSNPRSVAIIGASANPSKIGYDVLHNLITSGYEGDVYPINPSSDEILGLKAYKSVTDVPGSIDLVVIVVPARFVPQLMVECGEKGVKGVIVITAGFKEMGLEGAEMEKQLVEIAKQYGMRVIGPNCLGIIETPIKMNASFAPATPEPGSIAFMSQSGALCGSILDYALAEDIGFSHFYSLGNKADIDEVSLLEDWANDPNTNVVIAYIEGLKDGKAFIETASKATRKLPIVALKSGRTASGSKAVSSHTGSLAGSDAAYDAAFAQSGVLRADTVQDLFDFSTAFAYQPNIKGNRICLITNAGGPGVMATDALEQNDLVLAELKPETQQALEAVLPAAANTHNPVDVLGDARADRYGQAIEIVLKDEGVDGVIVILTPQSSTEIVRTAEVLVEKVAEIDKPVMGCWMGKKEIDHGIRVLSQNKLPNYPFPSRAVRAMGAMWKYAQYLAKPIEEPVVFDVDKKAVADLFAEIRTEGRNGIGDSEAQAIMKAYGITIPQSTVAATADEAVAFCKKIGYPVVMKIASPDILHKSDAGGIAVGVSGDDEVRATFAKIVANAKAYKADAEIWGTQIQEMVTGAKEIIIGMNRDPQFGPLVMFGLGGIYVEVLKDVKFRVAPMTRTQAYEMVQSIRSYALLKGVRGQAPSDIEATVDVLLRVAQLVTDFPEIAELDINPLLVREAGKGAVGVDMRLILK